MDATIMDTNTKKTIEIYGKHNIHTMTHGKKLKGTRAVMQELTDVLPSGKTQLDLLIKVYMTCETADTCSTANAYNFANQTHTLLLERELQKKIQGYKSQDIKRNIYDQKQLISYMEVVEKLVASKLKCAYCTQFVYVLYKDVRDPTQWTLDRKDNTIGHSQNNTVICCLKCNLQRRRIDDDKFMFTKRLKICKTGGAAP